MKKLILAAVATTCAVSVFAQGTVIFNNAVSGQISTRVFGPNSASPTNSYVGNRSTDLPAGSTAYPAGCLLIGTIGGMTAGTTFAALIGADGASAPESSLLPGLGAVTTFRTGTASGVVLASTATFNNIAPASSMATLEMVAWDNSSGLYGTWAQAQVAWRAGLIAAGESGSWNQPMGGGLVTAPNMVSSVDPTQHANSFNLFTIGAVPEPTTAALLGLGGAAILIFRRRK
jgi:hypothetical protein